MRRDLMTGLLATVIFVACIGSALAEKRVALLVGNGTYMNASRLSNPPRDATAIAELFRSARFDVVETRRDLSNLEFKRVLRAFNLAALDADIAVVFLRDMASRSMAPITCCRSTRSCSEISMQRTKL